MKHVLKISTIIEFDHDQESMTFAFPGSDFYRAKSLAMATLPMHQTTMAIEDIMFNNKESLQTRLLAIYLAGTIRGQLGDAKISIKIIEQ